MSKALLEVRELHKSYGDAVAVESVSFTVQTGEMFGLLGPNGAGKTTTLSILSCLMQASSGTATLLGQEIRPDNRQVRRLIGIVPQELAIYGELTARENLTFFGQLYGLHGLELQQRVDEVLAAIGLDDRANHRTDTFSGGMKRRLNFGAALVHSPRLLLLDEPTAGVDPQSRNHLFEEIRRVNQAGVTVVYTSHYMEEVQALCTRIGILDRGRLIACDTLPGLLRQLRGLIRFRVPVQANGFHERLRQLPGIEDISQRDSEVALHCQDVKGTLLRLLAVLNELQLELTSLETEEPNLERVFLHLTGRALRD